MNLVRRLRRPSPGTVIACVALFVSLGGTGYAVTQLPRNSVGPAQIRAKAVGAGEIRARAVRSSEIRNGSVRAKDLASGVAGSGPQGERGPQGEQGPPGPSAGPAGGDLTGSYPNPTIRDGAVTPARIGDIPAVRVEQTRNATQSVLNNTITDVQFGSEIYDSDAMFDPANNTRITFRTAGVYSVTGAARWAENGAGVRTIGLVPNDGFLQFLAADTRNNNGAGNPVRHSVSAVACFTANSFITLRVLQDSGGSLLINNLDSPQVHLAATWLAPPPAGGCDSV